MSESNDPPLLPGDASMFKNYRQDPVVGPIKPVERRNTSLAHIFDQIKMNNLNQHRENAIGKTKIPQRPGIPEIESENSEISDETDYSGKLPSDFPPNNLDNQKKEDEGSMPSDPLEDPGSNSQQKVEEDPDWDEAVDDDDIRYTLAADKAVEYILNARANAIKPGYESYKKLVDYAESLKFILILLICIFTILARPAWCANLGSKINWECTRSQDPENQVEYLKSSLPVLSASTKRVILLVSMGGISLLDVMKIIICKGDKVQRISFYFCLASLLCYSLGFFILEFDLLKISFLDIFALLYVIFGIKVLQKTLIKFVVVLIDAKEILVFFLLFILSTALIAR